AAPIAYAQPIRKMIQQGTTDLWTFNGATGDALTIAVFATEPITDDKTKVPAISLEDASGHVLASATATVPQESVIPTFTLPADGRYVVALPASSTVGYALVIQKRQSLLVSDATKRPLVPDRPLDSGITTKEPVNFWTFNAKAGSVLDIAGSRL